MTSNGRENPALFIFSGIIFMRYHYEKPEIATSMYGCVYCCDHPVYSRCTLFTIKDRGLAVIQQRFDADTKRTWWSELDPGLADTLYLSSGFLSYFEERAGTCVEGLYPTVTVRQMMWALRIKPLPKERWETVFDRKDI